MEIVAPRSRGIVSMLPATISLDSMIVAPIIAGTDSRNEYLKAVVLSIFLSNPVATVTPLLETPGIIAAACANPIKSESRVPSFRLPILFSEKKSAKPVISSAEPTTRRLLKSVSRRSWKMKPIRAMGMLPMVMNSASFPSFVWNSRFARALIMFVTSFLNAIRMTITVPV